MERAIDEITNEAIVNDENGQAIEINTDDLKQPEQIKKRIQDEFNYILKLMNFGNMGHEVFRRWYIDGRLFYHIVVDESRMEEGIKEVRYIDPRRIRKIREIQKMRDPATGVELIKRQIEYYLYNERGILGGVSNLGAKIAVDSVVNVNSGLMDPKQSMVLSYLHKAIKPLNNLRMVEDAVVIYRLSRAPERRIFYIDVGNMPTVKADQYVKEIMTRYRNKLVYDSTTGEIKDDRKHLSMLEDFWLPRREGSKGTEIGTLPPGQNLGQMEDVKYFQDKLYKALNIPTSRLEPQQGFSLGRSTEITRDELNFSKFIKKLRNKFSTLFDDLLRIQLVLKKVCTEEEWKEFKEDIWYDFRQDNNFDELKEAELLMNRLNILNLVQPYVGIYYSKDKVRKDILKFTEEEITEIQKQIDTEAEEDFAKQMDQQSQMMANQTADQYAQQGVMNQMQPDQQPQQTDPATKDTHGHEQKMMDKKIKLEKIKAASKTSSKKKIAEEAINYNGNGVDLAEFPELNKEQVND